MKKIEKISLLLLIFMIIAIFVAPNVLAIDRLNQVGTPNNITGITNPANKILGVIYRVAIAISIGMIVIIGIRYIISSPDQRADLKSRAIPYLIGAALVFATSSILTFISSVAGWIG